MYSNFKNKSTLKTSNLENGGDIISNLPDELLVHVLSFLSTENAFRTTILSSRWESLCTMVPILHFLPKEYYGDSKNENAKYVDFIERVFQSHNSHIDKFKIECTPEMDECRFNAWINAVVERKVQHIEVTGKCHFDMPRSLFTCKTLVTLKLGNQLQLDIPATIQFPCLKVFHISLVSPSDDLRKKLFCSCPALEELDLNVEEDTGDSTYNISSPYLNKLRVGIVVVGSEKFDSVVINVDAPVLESLEVINSACANCIIKNTTSLIKASVSIDSRWFYHDEVMENDFLFQNLSTLLKSVLFVKDLSICGRLPMKVFCSIFDILGPVLPNVTRLVLDSADYFNSSSFARWPIFPNLKSLQLNMAFENIPHLLALAPNLTFLEFVKGYSHTNLEQFDSSDQERVPICLQSSLREVVVIDSAWSNSEINLIKYLLANAQVLEKLTVKLADFFTFPEKKAAKVKSKIDSLPKCSKNFKLGYI